MIKILKYIMLFSIFGLSILIGRFISKQYLYRLKELEEIRNVLNIFKTKIKFTYEPIAEIFSEIAKTSNYNVSKLFGQAAEKMKTKTAGDSLKEAIEEYTGYIKKEDKDVLKTLSKMLGTTDVEGQISQIEVTESFLKEQIRQAQEEKNKNEQLYQKLGITIGMAIVIILIWNWRWFCYEYRFII